MLTIQEKEMYKEAKPSGTYHVILRQIGSKKQEQKEVTIICEEDRLDYVLKTCGVTNYSINTDKLVADEPAADAAEGAEPLVRIRALRI